MLDPHPRNDHMGNMEGKEPMHLQEPKLDGWKDQGNNNSHDKGNGTEPQPSNRRSTTHWSGSQNSRGFPSERKTQPQSGETGAATKFRRAQLETATRELPQAKF